MRMEIGLSQALLQKQILSPQMIQSMEILVLNAVQLDEKIEKELEENVALERVEAEGEEAALDGEPGSTVSDAATSPGPTSESATHPIESDASITAEIDLLRDRYEHLSEFQAEEHFTAPTRLTGAQADDEDDRFELLQNAPALPKSLQDHLIEQIRLRTDLDERQIALATELIYNIDDRGYLRYPLEEMRNALNARFQPAASEVAATGSAGSNGAAAGGEPEPSTVSTPATTDELEAALRVVQSLDPPGVGATDLKNCLLLQLERDSVEYPLERRLIEHHLEDIAKNRLPQLVRATGASLEAIKDAIETIKSLNPIPGRIFASRENSYVRPDVIIYEEDGIFKARVENESTPRLRISPRYRELLERSKNDPEIRKYIKKKIENAEFLLHAIQQRSSTLQRVASEIVKNQQEFFEDGPRHIKPLKMQQIADAVGVNVSTVSRAISGKYFQSPHCIRELKFLFTGGTTKDDGTVEARGSVIQRIHDLVNSEDKRRPLSDARIVTLLRREGINISRRTVTKYREAESIPSSRERRSF